MVERAAEAICNKAERVTPPGTIWRIKSDEAQERYRSQARAALEAALTTHETKEG
jgi:hypothetical protein